MNYSYSVLFVCLGNICRSPTAEAIFHKKLELAGLSNKVFADSAGTGDWHIGKPPDTRAQEEGAEHGYDLTPLRARQINHDDFDRFDLILAMDHDNLTNILSLRQGVSADQVRLLLSFSDAANQVVPDPYYGGIEGFTQVIRLVEQATDGLIEHIQQQNL